jgi:hypothetical protein
MYWAIYHEDLQAQVKKLQPKKTTTAKRKSTARRKRSSLDLFE